MYLEWRRAEVSVFQYCLLAVCNLKRRHFGKFVSRQTHDCRSLYTAISRKVVVKNVHATNPKGNMGYDQYTVA